MMMDHKQSSSQTSTLKAKLDKHSKLPLTGESAEFDHLRTDENGQTKEI